MCVCLCVCVCVYILKSVLDNAFSNAESKELFLLSTHSTQIHTYLYSVI